MINAATALWKGTGKDGIGQLNTKSTVLKNTQYSYKTRFEGAPGTNPEELIAAAHAGCFAMKLAFVFDAAGFPASELNVSCEIDFVAGEVKSSTLRLKAKVKDISKEEFDELVEDAGQNCPVSKLLNTTLKIQAELN